MVQNAKTQRIVLKMVAEADGSYVMKKCSDRWITLPFKWASRESALADLALVVAGLQRAGFEVVQPEKGETVAS
jgi:hypothetical protein